MLFQTRMKNKNILLLYYILSLIICKSNALKCWEEEIDNCLQCGTGEASNTCLKCKDKHFLFFNNMFCIPCDDPTYGQIGCGGNCDSSRYNEFRNVLCEENACKEGYYNLEGFCYSCSKGAGGCKKCTVEISNNNMEEKIYKCTECLNDEYLLDANDNKCYHCGMSNCQKCHYITQYNEPDNVPYYISECEICDNGYYIGYLEGYKQCKICKDPYRSWKM